MRKLVHDFLLWFPAVPMGGYLLLLGALATAAQAGNLQAKNWLNDNFSILISIENVPHLWIGLLILVVFWVVGFVLTIAPENRSPRDRLYLTGDREPSGTRLAEYMTAWSPSLYFWMPFSDYWRWSASVNHDLNQYFPVGWSLTNPGPGDVFHVQITWTVKGFDPKTVIEKYGLFAGFIASLTGDQVTISSDAVGHSQIDLSVRGSVEIPIIKAESATPVVLPRPMNNALAVAALAAAIDVTNTPVQEFDGIKSAIAQMARDTRTLPEIEIQINYENSQGRRVKSKFVVKGFVSGRVGLFRPVSGKANHYEPEPNGISAWIRLLEATRM